MATQSPERLAHAFESEARYCAKTGSAFAENFLRRAFADIQNGGAFAELVAHWRGDPLNDCLPLRLMGAVHRSILLGEAPELSPFYPSVGGSADWDAGWPHFVSFVRRAKRLVRPRLRHHVQTNEVLRAAVMLPGFLSLAKWFDLPMRLLEIGASAGLNLLWDRFRYDYGAFSWGDPRSCLLLKTQWIGPTFEVPGHVTVIDRAGCDVRPLAVTSALDVAALESFIWADQLDRLSRLRAAIAIARAHAPHLDRSKASRWLRSRLRTQARGQLTVVFASIFWIYLPDVERAAIRAALNEAGARATLAAPLAWLQMEGINGHAELRLTCWPSGTERLLATAEYNGQWIQWVDR